jgi:type III pantothenate kinase
MINLAIDIGNTRVKYAWFDQGELVEKSIEEDVSFEKILKRTTNHPVKNVILSSVGAVPNKRERQFFEDHFFFIQLTASTPIPIINEYRTPETLGKDRLAAVIGAYDQYPGAASLVIDAGTCITFDLIDAQGSYKGGNISPGLNMRLRAMHHFTAQLPLVSLKDTEKWLGYDTVSALVNGAQWGTIFEIEAFCRRCSEKYGSINVILTGGDADFLAKKLKRKIFVNHDLVLRGLNKILDYNAKQLE